MGDNLTVWSLCWGKKYPEYSVQRLQKSVSEHLTVPHRFVCVTDRQIEGVKCIPPVVDWPGWWGKIALHSWEVCAEENLFFDLDVVITGSLDQMVQKYRKCTLAMPLNWAQSGHGGCQSSVMMWKKNYNTKQIFDLFDPKRINWPPVNQPGVLWGDQEWITELRDKQKIESVPIAEGIYSYKYHCRQGLPDNCRVVVFHGDPKPWQVRESWYRW